MRLIEAMKHQGRPFMVPGCNRDDLPEFCKDMGFQVGAEIGVFKGKFTEKFCRMGLKMYAIDPWLPYLGAGIREQQQEKQDRQYYDTKNRLSRYDCQVIRKTSMNALADIGDGELDFVYIDGDHSFRHAAEDIAEWSRKVKKGGMVSGHDYSLTAPDADAVTDVIIHVKPVVDAYTQVYDLNFYILDEPSPSWMFIK